jgi:phosphocarrier protein HPr
MTEIKLILKNRSGLHARPAARFTQTAYTFKSRITIAGNNKKSDAKSIIMVMGMGLTKGTEVTITADGPDENECIEALKYLVESNFDEE